MANGVGALQPHVQLEWMLHRPPPSISCRNARHRASTGAVVIIRRNVKPCSSCPYKAPQPLMLMSLTPSFNVSRYPVACENSRQTHSKRRLMTLALSFPSVRSDLLEPIC